MKYRMRYLYAELKKTVRIFPLMLFSAMILVLLTGGAAFGAARRMEKEPLAVSVDIGVVVRGDDRITRLALVYVENMESAAKLCRFVQVSEEDGRHMLAEGELAALVVLPEELVEGIMDGRNPSVDVLFPRDARLEAMLFRELAEAGEGLLRVAQAQIYGAGDTAVQYGLTDELSVMEAEIDSFNLAFALDRLALYDEERVSATGRLSVAQHYAASGIVLFLLLSGMAAYSVMQPEPAAFRRQLMRAGVGGLWQNLCRWLCGFLYLLCLAGVLCVVWWGIRLCAPEAAMRLQEILMSAGRRGIGGRIGMLLLVLAAAASFHCMIYSASGSRTSGILLLFLLSIAAVYLSGGFVPPAFLPGAVRTVGEALPVSWMIRACGSLFAGYGAGTEGCAAWLCLYAVVFEAAACGLERLRSRHSG